MGGASTTSLNSVYVNPSNPASYSLIQPKKFIFHTSLKNNTTFLESSSENEVYNNAKLSSLIFGFPINNKIGLAQVYLTPIVVMICLREMSSLKLINFTKELR